MLRAPRSRRSLATTYYNSTHASTSPSPGISLLAGATITTRGSWQRRRRNGNDPMLAGVSVFGSTKISPTAGSSCLSASRSPAASDPRPRLSTQWPRAGLGSSTTRASTTGLLRALGSTGHRNSESRWFEDELASAGQRPNGTVRKFLPGRRRTANIHCIDLTHLHGSIIGNLLSLWVHAHLHAHLTQHRAHGCTGSTIKKGTPGFTDPVDTSSCAHFI